MESMTMRELKRNAVEKLEARLPCKLTSDSRTICVLLKVDQYNQLVRQYRGGSNGTE